jgi:hypothetical protein
VAGSYQNVFFDSKCLTSTAKPVMSVLFFLVFLVVGSFVMLSLFVGAVTMGMNDSIEAQEAELKAAQKAQREKQSPDDEMAIRRLLVSVSLLNGLSRLVCDCEASSSPFWLITLNLVCDCGDPRHI